MTAVAPQGGPPALGQVLRLDVLAALYGLEASILLILLALYKKAADPLTVFLSGHYAVFLFAGFLGVAVAAAYLVIRYRDTPRAVRRSFWLPVALNIVTVTLAFISGEATARLLLVSATVREALSNVSVLPRRWEAVVIHNRALLRQAPADRAYLVADDVLGWTVGRNRRSDDGMYFSSAEGIRSAAQDVRYAGRAGKPRIAIVGDSFTFAQEVGFDDSWGARLEGRLGPSAEVLNFGVSGYGVDQAYLRYSRDVRPLRPDLAVLGFINHDLQRSLVVYTFVSFPEWGFPFAKPRLVVDHGGLRPLNIPVPSPQELLVQRHIKDLPFIDYDPGFSRADWEWRPYHRSLVVRAVLSHFRRWPKPNAVSSDQAAITLNTEILTAFARQAERDGVVPLIVYFPARIDFAGLDRSVRDHIVATLRGRGIDYVDLTPCLETLGVSALFIPDHPHYSAMGNARVAACLEPIVRERLRYRGPAARS